MTILPPETPMTNAERAYQLWSVHPNDLDRLGFDRDKAHKSNAFERPNARALFYLAHIEAAIEQAVLPLPDTDNMMHMLRQFAAHHVEGEPIRLTSEDSRLLSQGILQALKALDALWETVNGRKLTDEEKGVLS